jgi:hypothetical protein
MANRVFQLSIQGVVNAAYRETVLHFQSTGTNDNDTLAAAESLCNGWDAACRTKFLLTLPPTYILVRITARRVALKPSATGCKWYGYGLAPGVRGSDCTANQTCPSVFLVPTMGTKSGGRIFWPCIPQADLTDSAPSAGWQTVLNNAVNQFVTGFTNAGITWVLGIFSRKLGTVSNVSAHQLSPVVGFQGRRRKPVGAP